MNSDDWQAAQRVVEDRHETLFQPQVEEFFERNIAQARSAGNQQTVRILENHLTLLRACKADGIQTAFATLTKQREQEEELPFDSELIARSVEALLGEPQKKWNTCNIWRRWQTKRRMPNSKHSSTPFS